MNVEKQPIDKTVWNRRDVFEFFSHSSNPFYMVTFRQDVTGLYDYTHNNGISFYYALCYLVTEAVNRVEAFHYTISGNDVYRVSERHPSFTDLHKDADIFHIVTMEKRGSLIEFCKEARLFSERQSCFLSTGSDSEALIYLSCLPWIDVTAITNERDLADAAAKDDSIPHISWGRYTDINGRKELGISIEVNHRLIDGLHIGNFAEELTSLIGNLNH